MLSFQSVSESKLVSTRHEFCVKLGDELYNVCCVCQLMKPMELVKYMREMERSF